MKSLLIAIDGPAAAGKGTLAPVLAQKLHGFYLQTGAMYRAVALFCLRNKISLSDEQAIVRILPKIIIAFQNDRVLSQGEDVTEALKQSEVSEASSMIARIPDVRTYLVAQQQAIGRQLVKDGKTVIAEGRDTGTRVFPDADLKIFLTADVEIRAQRRLLQLEEQGESVDFEDVLESVQQRDRQDRERKTDPLVSEPEKFGYLVVDDSELTEEETLERIQQAIQEREGIK